VTPEEIKAAALEAAQELLSQLQSQQDQLDLLGASAEIIAFARDRLEPLARRELRKTRDEVAAVLAEATRLREEGWQKYAPAAASLASLEGKLAAARAYDPALPDLEDEGTTLDDWRAAESAQRANQTLISELEERTALLRAAMFPLEQNNARCRDAVQAAERMLQGVDEALAAGDVFSRPAGRGTSVYAHFLLHSGLWRGDPASPIGNSWLRKSGKGAEIEARIEEGVRADERARGPQIRSAPSAHPLWEATSGPGFAQEGRTGLWEVNPGIPGHPPDA
jgi:hypothetical protein